MLDKNTIQSIIKLRKLTGISIGECKKLLTDCKDYNKILKQLIDNQKLINKTINGIWFTSYISTRKGLYIFKIHAGMDIYNNRKLWELRTKLNDIINQCPLNIERALNIKITSEFIIYFTTSLKYGLRIIGCYVHEKINEFVWKKMVVTVIFCTLRNVRKLISLSRIISQQTLSNYTVNSNANYLQDIFKSYFIYNVTKTTMEIINKFILYNNCIINIQQILLI